MSVPFLATLGSGVANQRVLGTLIKRLMRMAKDEPNRQVSCNLAATQR